MINKTFEPSAEAWFFRALLGPVSMIESIIITITIGTVLPGASLWIARRLAAARFKAGLLNRLL